MPRKLNSVSAVLAVSFLAAVASLSMVQARREARGNVVATAAMGQLKRPSKSEDPCRSRLRDQMVSEARKFKLELNRNSLTINSTADGFVAYASVASRGNATKRDLEKGVDVGFMQVDTTGRQTIPNGFYRIRIKARGEREGTASLISYEGIAIKELAASPVEAPAYIGGGSNCWVGGTYGVCFPAGTSKFQIKLWLYFMEGA